jgi:hypothetical protein
MRVGGGHRFPSRAGVGGQLIVNLYKVYGRGGDGIGRRGGGGTTSHCLVARAVKMVQKVIPNSLCRYIYLAHM